MFPFVCVCVLFCFIFSLSTTTLVRKSVVDHFHGKDYMLNQIIFFSYILTLVYSVSELQFIIVSN